MAQSCWRSPVFWQPWAMSVPSLNPFSLGAFTAALGVLLGAFGAHALSGIPAAHLAWWHTGTQYLFVAAFGMMLQGLWERGPLKLSNPAVSLALGALLFSGSLYAMTLGAPRWLGAITPIGGVSLAAGFLWMAGRALRRRENP
jgi:uncharacterized membrane protein YgdD (TMEM256/DUF423 family)